MPELERSTTVVYIEPVGTGASGRLADPSGYTLATYTHFLHAVIEHLGLTEVVACSAIRTADSSPSATPSTTPRTWRPWSCTTPHL